MAALATAACVVRNRRKWKAQATSGSDGSGSSGLVTASAADEEHGQLGSKTSAERTRQELAAGPNYPSRSTEREKAVAVIHTVAVETDAAETATVVAGASDVGAIVAVVASDRRRQEAGAALEQALAGSEAAEAAEAAAHSVSSR